jgi:hypothetical protein
MEIEIEKGNKFVTETVTVISEIQSISHHELSYDQFFHNFMSANVPVVIKDLQIKTKTSEKWFEIEKVKLENIQELIKDCEVPVANCSKKYFDSHEKLQMKFSDYAAYWNDPKDSGNLYLKDFHMKQEFPEIDFYNVPAYFASDWLNEFLIDNGKDDYRFIYFGPKNSW